MVGITRRQFFERTILTAGGLAAFEGFIREPRHPIGEEMEVRLARLPEAFDGFKIAQISDIHYGPYMNQAGVECGSQRNGGPTLSR
jgi:predicted MPP superfamily phosphohydrolase